MSAPVGGLDASGFNSLPEAEAERRLASCLGVRRWVAEVLTGRPYDDLAALRATADAAARDLTDDELDEALSGHPRIGEAAGAGHHAEFSAREQSGVDRSQGDAGARLAAANRSYEARFDRVFLIRAAGRDAEEILAELQRRLGNDPDTERRETIDNLREIALLRLEEVI